MVLDMFFYLNKTGRSVASVECLFFMFENLLDASTSTALQYSLHEGQKRFPIVTARHFWILAVSFLKKSLDLSIC